PRIGWGIRHGSVDHDASAEVDKEEHEDFAEAKVIGLHEVTSPRDMVLQEGRPALSIAGAPLSRHVSLNGSLADGDPKLQKLAANPLGAPERVACRHFADQRRSPRRRAPDSS